MRGRAATLTAASPSLGHACVSRHFQPYETFGADNMPEEDTVEESSNKLICCGCTGCESQSQDNALWRVSLAEFCGAALLVLLSCLPGCGPAGTDTPMHRAIAAGFVVTVLVQSLDHISGAYFNPAVLLAATLSGRVSSLRAVALLLAQVAGGAIGGGGLYFLQPPDTATCVTLPAENLSIYKAVLIEVVLSGCLVLVNCGAWDARNTGLRDAWPLRIGITVAGLSLVGAELTGASMNPVRSFGPALWSGNWNHHWVYWVGPLSGSLLCTLGYQAAWSPRSNTTSHNDKMSRTHHV